MNTTPTDEVVLKQDVLGRVKTPKARREQLLDEFERSGLSGQKFAESQPPGFHGRSIGNQHNQPTIIGHVLLRRFIDSY